MGRAPLKAVAALSAAVFLALLLSPSPAPLTAETLAILERPTGTRVTAIPIDFDRDDPDRKTFGKLVYRGGLHLFSASPHFGGYSGLAVDRSGTSLLAVSDTGTWMRATLDYDGRWLKRIGNVTLGPILGPKGRPLQTLSERDAEGLALVRGNTANGSALISFEREHRILRYAFNTRRFGPPRGAVALPKDAKSMGSNQGLEAVAVIRSGPLAGTVVAFAERLTDAEANLKGWLIGGPSPGPLTVRRLKGFDITDAAGLPDGGLVLLERRFRYTEGVKMRIRRIPAASLRPGRLIEGDVLLEATNRLNIDNMEAISVHRSRAGETILTLMSDDNFNPLQRLLIMQFAMP